jgi:hypothetical protein
MEWLGGGNSDSSGIVSFNLDLTDSSQLYAIEVNPPHNLRGMLAQSSFTGLTHAQLNNQSFAVSTPNLKIKVSDSNGVNPARWSWVGVEVVDPTNNNQPISWLTGAGTDRRGTVSLNLPASKRYKLMLNPGSGVDGSFTSCLFDVDGAGAVTKVDGSCENLASLVSGVWEIDLSAGNVTGVASYSDDTNQTVTLGGVLIVATSGNLEITTTTKANGSYGLELDPALTWTIEAFYVPKSDDPPFTATKLSLGTVTPTSPQTVDALFSANYPA